MPNNCKYCYWQVVKNGLEKGQAEGYKKEAEVIHFYAVNSTKLLYSQSTASKLRCILIVSCCGSNNSLLLRNNT